MAELVGRQYPVDRQGVCLPRSATLRDALAALESSGLGVVLVTDEQQRLLGLATEGDVRRALLGGHGLVEPLLTHANAAPLVGRHTMTRAELVALLSAEIHHVPVVDADGILVDLLAYDRRSIIPVSEPSIGERELRYVSDAVLSGWVSSQGTYITRFEELVADFCETRYAVSTCNGTCALQLALAALEIGPGDEVIVPALTFAATASAVLHVGAKAVFVDSEWTSWNMDPDLVRAAMTTRTRAIIAVHLYGTPCAPEIFALGEESGIPVVEDAAEAHGARSGGRAVGGLGALGCLSFFGNKILTTGEGGAVVSADDRLDARLRTLRDHGMSRSRRYWHDTLGYNFRMTNLQAALGVAQLERAPELLGSRERMRRAYSLALRDAPVECSKGWPGTESVCWLYTVLLNETVGQARRDEIVAALLRAGLDCRPVFTVLPAMPPFFEADWASRYPVARSISGRGLSLPTYHGLDEAAIQGIARAFRAELGESETPMTEKLRRR